jgi:hypothetical protein
MAETPWLIWSEEHGRWWRGCWSYTPSIVDAARFPRERAEAIVETENRDCAPGQFKAVALPDPIYRPPSFDPAARRP